MKFILALEDMYPWIPWEVVTDPLGPAGHILETPDRSPILRITYDINAHFNRLIVCNRLLPFSVSRLART